MEKAKLVQYRGGGYDGCIWEWNYAILIDNKFHDIYSSGCCGCDNIEKLVKYIKNKNIYYAYNLLDKKSIKDFTDNSNNDDIYNVAQYISENLGIDIFLTCTECNAEVLYTDVFLEGARGCGGIAITHDEIICQDCNSLYSCAYCQEFYGSDYDFDENGNCEDCQEKLKKSDIEGLERYIKENLFFGNTDTISAIKRLEILKA